MTEARSALAGASAAIVADALDALGLSVGVADPGVRPLWAGARVVGVARTCVVCSSDRDPDEPYRGEMDALDALRPGEVAVHAVEEGCRAATWGELFACAALGRAAVGVVTDGLVRDAAALEELGFPVFARGCSPLDTLRRAEIVDRDVRVVCGGAVIEPGDVVVGDADGVVVVPASAVEEVAARVHAKGRLEAGARRDLLAGAGVHDVWERYGTF